MRFEYSGTPTTVSKEFVRAWLHATACVLAYHGKPAPEGITVRFWFLLYGAADGTWEADTLTITLQRDLDSEAMATSIVHEMIHACLGDFGEGTDEKCTSTLTARLKPEIKVLADQLLEGTYRRAAYLAHTKLSYRSDAGDYYDSAQEQPVGAKDRYR